MVLLVLSSLLASACSGDGSDVPTSTPASTTSVEEPDAPETTTTAQGSEASSVVGAPCTFVSDAEMSDLLGKDVTSEAVDDLLCVYSPGDGSGGIELLIQDVSDVGCELVFSVGGFEDEEPVEGVGTYAMYKASGVSQMAVCFDDRDTLTSTMYAEPSDPKAVLTAVAAAVEQGLS